MPPQELQSSPKYHNRTKATYCEQRVRSTRTSDPVPNGPKGREVIFLPQRVAHNTIVEQLKKCYNKTPYSSRPQTNRVFNHSSNPETQQKRRADAADGVPHQTTPYDDDIALPQIEITSKFTKVHSATTERSSVEHFMLPYPNDSESFYGSLPTFFSAKSPVSKAAPGRIS